MKKRTRDTLLGAFIPGRAFTIDDIRRRTGLSRATISYGLPLIEAVELEGFWPRRYYIGTPPKVRDIYTDGAELPDYPRIAVEGSTAQALVDIGPGATRIKLQDVINSSQHVVDRLSHLNEFNDFDALKEKVAKQARFFASLYLELNELGPDWKDSLLAAYKKQQALTREDGLGMSYILAQHK